MTIQEQESSEIMTNKFKFTYAGISKDDIIQRSTTELFAKIKANLQSSNTQITGMERRVSRAKAKQTTNLAKLHLQYGAAEKAYLQAKTARSMRHLNNV